MLAARRLPGLASAVGAIAGLAVFAFAARHFVVVLGGQTGLATAVYLGSLVLLLVQFAAAQFSRPFTVDAEEQAALERLTVVVLVPCYNEDPQALRLCLGSLLEQTRLPQAIALTDDGSTTSDYATVREWFVAETAAMGVRGHWRRTENAGKRSAQVVAARLESTADIYVTVDSDSRLDAHALEEGLKPFADRRVQSVAAVILTANYGTNLLTRMMDLFCVSLQLGDRSALSTVGSVMVNSGGCAF
ncbi:glycosyltransferase [Rathayibacter sp. YIM 133350]|uniref:glycosyltransferase n=1 Tax=Rathayibacter sp. YIM 133350 TaxID=3131992 RepID=UPI00307D7814